mmetsp:Transcript_19958/g.47145  ORF Transcript_19958/g.47145 Transcript_19958/m.47145 type:complete len:226 (-) Transcript_19958:1337-2014(-)
MRPRGFEVRVLQRLFGGHALDGIPHQKAPEEASCTLWRKQQVAIDVLFRGISDISQDDLLGVAIAGALLPLEDGDAAEHLQKDDPEGPQVALLVVGLFRGSAVHHLWCQIAQGAQAAFQLAETVFASAQHQAFCGEAEVDELQHLALVLVDPVPGLDVPVHDALGVDVAHYAEHLYRRLLEVRLPKGPLRERSLQCAARAELHDQTQLVVVLVDVEESRNVWVLQ